MLDIFSKKCFAQVTRRVNCFNWGFYIGKIGFHSFSRKHELKAATLPRAALEDMLGFVNPETI